MHPCMANLKEKLFLFFNKFALDSHRGAFAIKILHQALNKFCDLTA